MPVAAPQLTKTARDSRLATVRADRIRTGIRLILTYGLLLVFAAAMVGPFLLMVSASLQPNMIYLTFPMQLIGPDMGFANYVTLFNRSLIGRWIFNSGVITVSIVLLQLVTCSMSGYA